MKVHEIKFFFISLLLAPTLMFSSAGQADVKVSNYDNILYDESLNEVMEPAPELLEKYINEFNESDYAVGVEKTAYWMAFHFWLADKFNTYVMTGEMPSALNIKQARWLSYVTCYWGGVEERMYYAKDMPFRYSAMMSIFKFIKGNDGTVAHIVQGLKETDEALASGGKQLFDYLGLSLRTKGPGPFGDIIGNIIYSTAYDTFYVLIASEAPPNGVRPGHLAAFKENLISASTDEFLEIDYAYPIPDWLAATRSQYQLAKSNKAQAYKQLINGDGDSDLVDLWKKGYESARNNWGRGQLEPWNQGEYDVNMHGNVLWNFGLEAVSMKGISGLLMNDVAAAKKALLGNSLYLAAWNGFAISFGGRNYTIADLPVLSN